MAKLRNNTLVCWDLEIKIIKTNDNALEISICQPIDMALETKHILYNTDMKALEKFAKNLLAECKLAKQN